MIPGLGRSGEKEMATHSSTLAWKTPWTEEPWRLRAHGVAKSWTRLSMHPRGTKILQAMQPGRKNKKPKTKPLSLDPRGIVGKTLLASLQPPASPRLRAQSPQTGPGLELPKDSGAVGTKRGNLTPLSPIRHIQQVPLSPRDGQQSPLSDPLSSFPLSPITPGPSPSSAFHGPLTWDFPREEGEGGVH